MVFAFDCIIQNKIIDLVVEFGHALVHNIHYTYKWILIFLKIIVLIEIQIPWLT